MHMLARADACAAPPPRFAGLAPAPLAVSLASSDSACSINRTLRRALDFLAPSTRLVVHIGCGSPATTEERKALGAISPRVIVNPRCESVDPQDGTLLHAHLLNMRVLAAAPPGAALLAPCISRTSRPISPTSPQAPCSSPPPTCDGSPRASRARSPAASPRRTKPRGSRGRWPGRRYRRIGARRTAWAEP